MEDPEEDWSMGEYYPYSSTGEDDQPKSTMGWIWNTGLNLGKKVALTGFVITSAPIVLPPLVFMSALGFVVSIPMGVFYVSYAASEKLMSKLLPMPAASPSPPPWEEELEDDQQESHHVAEIEMEKEVKHETQEEDDNEDVEMRIEFVEEQEEDRPNQDVEVEQVVDEKPLVEESRKEEALPMPEVNIVTIVAVEDEVKVSDDVVIKKEEVIVVSGDVELLPAVSQERTLSEKEKEAAGTKHSLEKMMDEGSSSASESSRKSHSKKKSKHHHHLSKKTHGISGKKEDKHGAQGTPTNGNHATSGPKSNEMTTSEEKIWEQINALRLIVGYKIAPHKSFMEELKALYIFTGVEPPSSFDQSINLRDAEDKLHFLMSVVGVK